MAACCVADDRQMADEIRAAGLLYRHHHRPLACIQVTTLQIQLKSRSRGIDARNIDDPRFDSFQKGTHCGGSGHRGFCARNSRLARADHAHHIVAEIVVFFVDHHRENIRAKRVKFPLALRPGGCERGLPGRPCFPLLPIFFETPLLILCPKQSSPL